jgi:AcrR family transcriptional regulator
VSPEHDNRPIWALPQPAERKPRFSREQITRAALRVADEEGFEAVTMKRIAAELGAGTMTLYYYVRNKTDVVALMQDAIMADMVLPAEDLPGGWREAVAAIARRTRQVMMAHPWSVGSLNEAQAGPQSMRHVEQSLAATAATGLPVPARLELLTLVDDYVFGNVLRSIESLERAEAARADPAMVAAMVEFGVGQLSSGEFPELSALYEASALASGPGSADSGAGGQPAEREDAGPPMTGAALAAAFERGLDCVLDGVAARWGLAVTVQGEEV